MEKKPANAGFFYFKPDANSRYTLQYTLNNIENYIHRFQIISIVPVTRFTRVLE